VQGAAHVPRQLPQNHQQRKKHFDAQPGHYSPQVPQHPHCSQLHQLHQHQQNVSKQQVHQHQQHFRTAFMQPPQPGMQLGSLPSALPPALPPNGGIFAQPRAAGSASNAGAPPALSVSHAEYMRRATTGGTFQQQLRYMQQQYGQQHPQHPQQHQHQQQRWHLQPTVLQRHNHLQQQQQQQQQQHLLQPRMGMNFAATALGPAAAQVTNHNQAGGGTGSGGARFYL